MLKTIALLAVVAAAATAQTPFRPYNAQTSNLSLYPPEGPQFLPGRVAFINSNGQIDGIAGTATNCVLTNGSTSTCAVLLSGTLSQIPATCAVGSGLFQATDQPAGLQLYECTSANVWTRQAYSQGASTPATCTVGQIFFDTAAMAGQNMYLCASANVWTQIVSAVIQTGGVNNASQLGIDFVNPAGFNGLSFAWSNPSGTQETFGVSGQLGNSGLANPSTTVNGQSCVLGASCTVPVQTGGVGNTSQAGVNFIASSTNSVGLTVTPSNPGTNQEKMEVTGSSYTGNAATATALAATPSQCGAGLAAQGIAANGNAQGCQAVGGGGLGATNCAAATGSGTATGTVTFSASLNCNTYAMPASGLVTLTFPTPASAVSGTFFLKITNTADATTPNLATSGATVNGMPTCVAASGHVTQIPFLWDSTASAWSAGAATDVSASALTAGQIFTAAACGPPTGITPGASGHTIRSNGTSYVDAQMSAADLSDGNSGTGQICHVSGSACAGGSAPTISTDVYHPWGYAPYVNGAVATFGSANEQRVWRFTPLANYSMTHWYLGGIGGAGSTGHIAVAITDSAGTAIITNATCNMSWNNGNATECSWAGTVSLSQGTTYNLVLTGDLTTINYSTWYEATSQYVLSAAQLNVPYFGTAANPSTGSGGTLAVAVPLGTITASTLNFPVGGFLP